MRNVEIPHPPSAEIKTDFNDLLSELATNMRRYDELVAERSPMLDAKEVLDAQFEDLDLEEPAEMYPKFMALTALEKILLDRRIEALNTQLSTLEGSWTDSQELLLWQGYRNRKVEIEPLYPDEHPLVSLEDYNLGMSGTYSGSTKKPKKGRIKDISLGADIGGILVIETRFSGIYKAWGLIDRENDYTPAFSIRNLD